MLGILVVGVLAVVAFTLRGRDRMPSTPEAVAEQFFDAAGRGDDATYVGLTCGELSKSLGQSRTELGPAVFRENLKRSVESIEGLAFARSDDVAPEGVALDVELIFKDRTEAQRMLFLPKGNGWAVAAIETSQTVKQEIPWGTPVFP